jgi:hypothetical protein
MKEKQEGEHFEIIENKRPSRVDTAKIHIGDFGQHHLHATDSTNTVAMKNLADISSAGDGIGSPGELQ